MTGKNKRLHIIAFDVPDPADYGGVIDVFHMIRSLSTQGVEIVLHCFQYGRPRSEKLKELCAEVHYYPRSTGLLAQLSLTPYIVQSRRSSALMERLLADDHPIIAAGLHCTGFMRDIRFAGRKVLVRATNIEHQYYRHLAMGEKNLLRKLFFFIEAWKLRGYEKMLKDVSTILAISPTDEEGLVKRYGRQKVVGVAAFHPYDKVESRKGKGNFILYHGKLDVPENYNAAFRILPLFAAREGLPLWVAGMNPPSFLVKAMAKYPRVVLKANPSQQEMADMIGDAQAHLLITGQATGMKLKLLAALFSGRFVIANEPMVIGTGLQDLCITGNTDEELTAALSACQYMEFSDADIRNRETVLEYSFSNHRNGLKLMGILFGV